MSIEQENAQYIYQYKGGCFSKVITYKKYLIRKIKDDLNAKSNTAIQAFSSEGVTSGKFETFVQIASDAGYTIYKVEKL